MFPSAHTFVVRLVGWLAIAALVVVAISAGLAFAAGGQPPGGTIHACARDGERTGGFLRLVSSEDDCRAHEVALSWNTQGVPGPAGPAGQQGPPGPAPVFVNIDGATGAIIVQSESAGALSSQRTGPGGYEIVFDHDVTHCPRWVGFGPVSGPHLYATAQGTVAPEDFPVQAKMTVVIYDLTGSYDDASFSLQLICPQA